MSLAVLALPARKLLQNECYTIPSIRTQFKAALKKLNAKVEENQ